MKVWQLINVLSSYDEDRDVRISGNLTGGVLDILYIEQTDGLVIITTDEDGT